MKKHFRLVATVMGLAMATSAFAACGTTEKKESETNSTTAEVTWGDWETVKAATCVSGGTERRISSEGEVDLRTTDALGHNFENGFCTRCGLSEDDLSVLKYGVDYTSLYSELGAKVTIADVEQSANGDAYIYVKDGKLAAKGAEGATKTLLGMDFLSMAMVYNTAIPEGSEYKTEDEVYAQWWKLYIQRWNKLLPEIPLYSNEYYDMYNKKLGGVEEHPTNPYWAPANALIDWTSEDGKIILGSSTELGGKFRYASFGANSPASSDSDVAGLTQGLATVTANKEGNYQVDDTVVKDFQEKYNEDGTLTFTIEIHPDLKFSDGSAITAKNYLVTALVFSSPVGAEAAGKDHKAGLSYAGYNAFAKYDGTNDGVDGASKAFAGFRLLGDYKFSATVTEEYATYFYKIIQAGFTPNPLNLWLGEGCDIKDDGDGAYIDGNFYAKADGKYTAAAHIKASAFNTDTTYPYSGPYMVESYDSAEKIATLKLNPNYKGNYEGTKPQIGTVIYKKVVSETQLADFQSGGVDVLAAITGGDETNEAIGYANGADDILGNDDDNAIMTHYSRAGYGKLGFRGDFGPVQSAAVRQAIALCLDRAQFASDFTGGYGGVVDGPYYTGAWMYQEVKDEIILNAYAKSVDDAKEVLEADGWRYNADGTAYSGTGVRYKRFAEAEITEDNRNYSSLDGSIKTVKIGDYYYMPLLLNWFGTTPNPFTDLLVIAMENGDAFAQAGFAIKKTLGDFAPMLDELYQYPVYGFYGGTPRYTCFNFATGFSSAVYDYAYNWSIDPAFYDDYSICYIKDTADIYRLPKVEEDAE